MKKLLKDKKAITLIALVITIVVLVILAAVTISMTVGNDGLIAKAIKAANDYKNSKTKEEQEINDLYGKIKVASDGTIENLTLDGLEDFINKKIDSKLETADTTPVGTIIAYSKDELPSSNYVKCDGSAISRTTYSKLFEKIGTAYGAGDGSTTFNVPDLRGEFLRGTGTNSHYTDTMDGNIKEGDGSAVGTHQYSTTMPRINTRVTNTGSGLIWFDKNKESANNDDVLRNPDSFHVDVQNNKSIYQVSVPLSANQATWYSEGGTQITAYSTRPTNTSVLYCIKAK